MRFVFYAWQTNAQLCNFKAYLGQNGMKVASEIQ